MICIHGQIRFYCACNPVNFFELELHCQKLVYVFCLGIWRSLNATMALQLQIDQTVGKFRNYSRGVHWILILQSKSGNLYKPCVACTDLRMSLL